MGLTRSFNFEDARGRVDGETVALGIVFAGHLVVEGILIFAVEIAIELHHPGGELRGPLRLGIKHERWAPGSAMPTNRLWRPPGRQQMAVSSTAPPRRTRSAELGRTAAPAVAPRHWCGDAGTSAGSTGLHNVRKQRSARLSLVLCSGELGGRSVVRRCRLPSVCYLRPPQPVSAPLALVPRDLVRTQGGRPATGATGLHTPPPRKEKHRKSLWKPVAGVAALPVCWLRPPPLLVVPALRVLVLLLPVFRRRHSWQPRKRIRRNGAYVYHVVPKAFR